MSLTVTILVLYAVAKYLVTCFLWYHENYLRNISLAKTVIETDQAPSYSPSKDKGVF